MLKSVSLFIGFLVAGIFAARHLTMSNFLLLDLLVLMIVITIYWLAKADIFFTFVKEGSAKAILYNGAFHRAVLQYRGHKLDENSNVVVDDNGWKKILGGLRWVGIPPLFTLHRYKFRWITIRPQSGKLEKREEKLDFILVRDDVYGLEVKGAESQGMVPLDITLLLTMRCVNPYKALFVAQDWSEMIFDRSEATFREYVSGEVYEDLVKQEQAAGGALYNKLQEQGLLAKFLEDYGIEIKAIEMKEVKAAGTHAEALEKLASQKWQAEKDQQRIEVIANAEVGRIEKVYRKIQEFGDQGTAIRFMESLDKAGEKSGNWIIPFGDIRTAAQSLIGGKNISPVEDLLKSEGITYAELKEAIKKMKGGVK